MRNQYLSAPLPFVGQKRMFVKEYIKVLNQYPNDAVFVDLFGGSGLLSHIAKCQNPNATVVYNDYDNYRQRLEYIPYTNALLAEIREIVKEVPKYKPIKGELREKVLDCISNTEVNYGYVDFITLSSNILFSMKYKLSVEELKKEVFYNCIRTTDYPICKDYLQGLIITSTDYKELFQQYKDVPNVVFIVDPPYLNTDVGTYKMYWRLADYLDVLTILAGHEFIYFTSNKSSIIELCEWIGHNKTIGNPFQLCKKVEFNAHMNHNAKYTDIMLYKKHSETPPMEAA